MSYMCACGRSSSCLCELPPVTADRVVARAVDSAFRCDVCGERCTSKRALDEHAATHPVTADVQRELAEALADELSGWPIGSGYYGTKVGNDEAREMVERLLPLIADAEKRAAARALREAADEPRMPLYGALICRHRAAALDPSGAAEGAGR